jgi:quercetin dioxygenase-like cupin family protein
MAIDYKSMLADLHEGMPKRPTDDVNVVHFFGDGVYIRRSIVPKGREIMMHVHSYGHFSVVCKGSGTLATEEGPREVQAGDVIEIEAGKMHAFQPHEDTIWLCVHATSHAEAAELYVKNERYET